jgi:hypothetical protein
MISFFPNEQKKAKQKTPNRKGNKETRKLRKQASFSIKMYTASDDMVSPDFINNHPLKLP